MNKAIVLLSGGLDSTTALAVARSWDYDCFALSFDYGQRHARAELGAARRIAAKCGIDHRVQHIDLSWVTSSALTNPALDVPKGRDDEQIGHGIPVTYVPARNPIFLSLALAWAETVGARDLFIGANVLDYSGYPDCRPIFLEAFELMARAATDRDDVRVRAPLLKMAKREIVELGHRLGVSYADTWSCYDPVSLGPVEMKACGGCDSCSLRRKGFAEAGVEDPTVYA